MAQVSRPGMRLAARLGGVASLFLLVLATHVMTKALVERARVPRSPLVVEPELARVLARSVGDERPATFKLTNRTHKPVTIRSVSSSCTCVAAESYDGAPLAPGQSLALTFSVRTPRFGVTRTRLEVVHDGGSDPAEMYVEAVGAGTLPVVRHVRNASPTFAALGSPRDDQRTTIRTYEPPGSAPWISRVQCDVPESWIELVDRRDEEQPEATVVEREYSFRVSWKKLPATTEFSGRLSAITSAGASIPIGTLSGRLASVRPFSPDVARLVPGEHPREIILFRSDDVHWAIARDASLPAWLEAEWQAAGGFQRLALKLRETANASSGAFDLPLVSDRGHRHVLTVMRIPSATPQ